MLKKILWRVFIIVAIIFFVYNIYLYFKLTWGPQPKNVLTEDVRKEVYRCINKIEKTCNQLKDINGVFDLSKRDMVQLNFIGNPAAHIYLEYFNNKEKDWKLRFIMAQILVKIGYDEAVKPFIKTMQDESEDIQIRVASCIALGGLNNSAATEPLIEIMNNTTGPLQLAAINALGEIRDTSAQRALQEQMKIESSTAVKGELKNALNKVGKPKERKGPPW